MRLLANILLANILLAGCGTVEQRPPEQRTQVIEVKVPVPIPCIEPKDRPVLPTPTAIDPETASTEQLAAAELADAIALTNYAATVDRLFEVCMKISQ